MARTEVGYPWVAVAQSAAGIRPPNVTGAPSAFFCAHRFMVGRAGPLRRAVPVNGRSNPVRFRHQSLRPDWWWISNHT